VAHDLTDEFLGVNILNAGAHRHTDVQGLTLSTAHLATHPVLAALRAMAPVVTEINERVQAAVGAQNDMATVTTIATVGTTARNVFLTPEADATIAAVSRLDRDHCLIDEFHA
jgi:hypothetical protein